MASINLSDPEIQKGVADVLDPKTDTNWVLLTYAPRSATQIRVAGSGTGGWDEMCDEISDGKIFYGLCRFTISEVFRYVYLSWIGEGVQGMQAGAYNTHSNTMQRVFEGYHVQINGRNDADLWEEDVIARLGSAIGANYDAGQRIQGVQGRDANSGVAKKMVKTDPGTIDQEKSAEYWAQQNAATGAPASGYKKDLSFQKASGASSLKSKFETLAEQQKSDAPAQRSTPAPIQIDTSSGPTVIESTPEPSNISYDNSGGATYDDSGYDEGASYDEGGYEEPATYDEGGYDEGGYEEPAYDEGGYDEGGYEEGAYEEGGYEEGAYEEVYATALYDYAGENADDLSFSAGDSIQVLDQSDPSGWWKGYIDGREGFFPSNFVELC